LLSSLLQADVPARQIRGTALVITGEQAHIIRKPEENLYFENIVNIDNSRSEFQSTCEAFTPTRWKN
jgi:hypothetical protein